MRRFPLFLAIATVFLALGCHKRPPPQAHSVGAEVFVNTSPYLLEQGCLAADTTLFLQGVQGLPTVGTFRMRMGNERLKVTAVSTSLNTITVVRGQEGSSAFPQLAGTALVPIITAQGMAELSYQYAALNNVLHPSFGADPTDTTDSTTAIQNAVNASLSSSTSPARTYVPAGTYRINGTIVVGSGQRLDLDPAAVLHRHSGGSTAPIVRLTGNQPKLTGEGLIFSEVAPMPRGIVLVGPAALSGAEQINRAKIEHVYIRGTQTPGDGSMGIWVDSSEPTAAGYAGGGNDYQGSILDPTVQGVDEAVHFDQAANGWTTYGVQAAYIGRFMFRSHAATGAGTLQTTENSFHGGFITQSGSLTAIISCENAGYQLFYGVQGEPGGGKFYQIDANSEDIQVHGHNAAIVASTDSGTNSIITSNGASSSAPAGTGSYLLANGNLISPKNALPDGTFWTLGRYGFSTKYVQLGPVAGGGGGSVVLGDVTDTAADYALFSDGTSQTVLNTPTGGTLYLRANNSTQLASFTASQVTIGEPITLTGQTLATSATAGSRGAPPSQVNGYLEMVVDFGSGPANIRIPFYQP